MGLTLLLAKYLLIFSGFSSVAIVPIMYSSGTPLEERKSEILTGGSESLKEIEKVDLQNQSERPSQSVSVGPLREKSRSEEIQPPRKVRRSAEDVPARNPVESKVVVNEAQESRLIDEKLRVNGDLLSNLRKLVDYESFKSLYGSKNFREEGSMAGGLDAIGPKGAEKMSILDAGAKFFENKDKNSREVGNSFFLKNNSDGFPFWNREFPYIAVEIPKGLALPTALVGNSMEDGGFKVTDGVETLGLEDSVEAKFKGLKNQVQVYKRVMEATGEEKEQYRKNKTLDKIMQPQDHADLYLVSDPESLLKNWLADGNSLTPEGFGSDKYALFDNNHYSGNEYHPEVSILRRGHNGKAYRMGLFHKELKSSQIPANKTFEVGYDNQNRPKNFKLDLKWSKNFLLNIMVGYTYTFKEDANIPPQSGASLFNSRELGKWNLMNIYSPSERGKYKDNFAKGVRDGYDGSFSNDYSTGWNLFTKHKLSRMKPFTERGERINGVGEAMDKHLSSGGKLNEEGGERVDR